MPRDAHLGDWVPKPCSFPNLEAVFKEFSSDAFQKLSEHQKLEKINYTLLDLIQRLRSPAFFCLAYSILSTASLKPSSSTITG
jgi:hypothetical protein